MSLSVFQKMYYTHGCNVPPGQRQAPVRKSICDDYRAPVPNEIDSLLIQSEQLKITADYYSVHVLIRKPLFTGTIRETNPRTPGGQRGANVFLSAFSLLHANPI
eukprot:COSAG02_NODE_183_length_30560_cov_8.912695_6_plen_104_part_00